MRKRIWIYLVPAVFLAAGAAWLLLQGGRVDRTNLLLITLDTTRADHLGVYGYGRAQTPVLDSLAGRGTVFTRFFTNVPLTLPAHATILTGRLPPEHGLRVNASGQLPGQIPTLAEFFSGEDYRTGAFVAAFVLDRKFGLNRGFEVYDDYGVPDSDEIYDDSAMYRYRRGNEVADAALAWLEEDDGRPFFCWVHFFDPHHPYYFPPPPGEGVEGAYDREIAFMDSQVGRLLDFLRQRGLEEETVVIALGDHGEGLGDHGEDEHGLLLYSPVTRVPLIAALPRRESGPEKVETLLSTADLFPTVIELFGKKPPAGISGRSFAPALAGKPMEDGEIYLETEFPFTEYGWSPLAGLVSGEWKYIRGPNKELYNLADDPGETVNLAGREPGRVGRMEAGLAAVETSMDIREAGEAELGERERALLESLGYLGTGGTAVRKENGLRNPAEAIGLRTEFIAAMDLFHRGKSAEAERRLKRLIDQSPESYIFRFRLARLYYDEERLEEAAAAFRGLAVSFPGEFRTHYNLGKTLNRLGRYREAIAELELSLEIDPEETAGWNNLGIAFLKTGRLEEAISTFQRSIGIDERQLDPHNNLGNALLALGRVRPAAASFARAVEIDPEFFEGRFNLGLTLVRLGRNREAAAQFEQAVKLRPDFLPARRQRDEALRRAGEG
ncbi:MAG: sulfatase-like hydrolase/transferase [Candidatus Erginobacter occultus]|nr:sulfatase-like hydrolase/transferase [Candidatus Erginobacter occultus]